MWLARLMVVRMWFVRPMVMQAAQEQFVPTRDVEERYFCNYGCKDTIFTNTGLNSVI